MKATILAQFKFDFEYGLKKLHYDFEQPKNCEIFFGVPGLFYLIPDAQYEHEHGNVNELIKDIYQDCLVRILATKI